MKKICGLENWQFATSMNGGGDTWNLCGNVFGHPCFPDGHAIQIGQIIKFNRDELYMTVETERTQYVLGMMAKNALGGLEKQIKFIEEEIAKLV